MKFKQTGLSVVLIGFLLSCSGDKLDGKLMRQEMNRRRIIRVTDAQLLSLATQKGQKTLNALDSLVKLNPNWSQEKAFESLPINESLKKPYFKIIPLTGNANFKASNPKLDEVINSYQGFSESDPKLGDNVQRLGDSSFVFSRPIVENNRAVAVSILILSKVILVDDQAQKGKKWGKPVQ